MPDLTDDTVLAIDGGGTRCRYALVSAKHRIEISTGPANVFSDFIGAIDRLANGLFRLAEAAGQPLDWLSARPAFVGLAGAIDADSRSHLKATLPLRHVIYADDRPAALRGAFTAEPGFLMHAGTGSFLAARQNGSSRFVGGWGALLGDEASAHWVGRSALTRTLHRIDGFDAPTPLTDALLARFQSAHGILRFVDTATPSDIGAIAPLVTDLALQGDPIAVQIMQAGAEYLGAGLGKLGWTFDHPVCLTGGIAPCFEPYLPAEMRACVTAPAGTPLDGAVALAQDLRQDLQKRGTVQTAEFLQAGGLV